MDIRQKMKDLWEKKKKALLLTAVVIIGCVLLLFFVKYLIDNWTYSGYTVVTETLQEDTVSTNYIEFGENILKYGGDEVSLLNRQGDALWNEPQTIDNPMVDICGEYCVTYGKNATSMTVFNMEGKKGTIQTGLPILKAKIASQGVVAAILEDGETTWINLYDVDGEEIVTGKSVSKSILILFA